MKKLFNNMFLFTLPFFLFFVCVYFIDPFNYYNKRDKFEKISSVALKIQPHLFKLINFKNNPNKNILLGDSRSNALYSVFEDEKKQTWNNLSYGGASLNEVIDTFWYAAKNQNLDSVVVGVNFNHFNANNSRNWVKKTMELSNNSISYTYSKYVFSSIIQNFKPMNSKHNSKSSVNKDVFWETHLKDNKDKFYLNIIYPEYYFQSLTEIKNYCYENDIKLIFWIPPVHQDIHDIIYELGHLDKYKRFINDLSSLSDTYNFDNDLVLRNSKTNFRDAMHVDTKLLRNIYIEIFKN